MTDDTLRVCILFDGETTFAWVAEAIGQMLEETNTEISLVVINKQHVSTNDSDRSTLQKRLDSVKGIIHRTVEKPHWARIVGGQLLLDKLLGEPAYRRTISIDEIEGVREAPRIFCMPIPSGRFGNELPDDVVERIGKESDLIFRRGFGIIKGDVLTVTEYGVVSYHHDDPTEYRGGPAGFWEYLHGRDRAGLMLQLLSEELDAGGIVVYDEIDISDANTWREVHRRLCTRSIDFLATGIERLQDPDFEPTKIEPLGPVYTAPDIKNYLRYQLKNNLGRLRNAIGRLV